jgi:hypothetical protein
MKVLLEVKKEDTTDFIKHLECLHKVAIDDIESYRNGINSIDVDKLAQHDIINIINFAITFNKEIDLTVWEVKGGIILYTFNSIPFDRQKVVDKLGL